MPRSIVVGNDRVTVALDNRMFIRDFFYPSPGLENHILGHEFKLGVWADGLFRWLGNDWEVVLEYMPETLVSKCAAKSRELNVGLEINDAVYSFQDIYLKKVVVSNLSERKRSVVLLFTHDFHIYGEAAGDTALYEPSLNSVIHYKRKRYFLVNGLTNQGQGIYQFAIGYKESPGKEGTWKDAEDGVLQKNPIAQGSVDSTVSFKLEMNPNSSNSLYYWIACGENIDEVKDLNVKIKQIGVEQLLLETENYGSAWVNKQNTDLSILPREVILLFKTSLLIMRAHVNRRGAIIASCDSDVFSYFNRDTYAYVWTRDGSLAAMAFDKAGFPEISRRFFQFCSQAITRDGFFSHKYLADGSIGSTWHAMIDLEGNLQLPIQEDETALVLYALWKHFKKYRDVEFIRGIYDKVVIKATDFLLKYRDAETGLPKPTFDVWEERIGTFTATTATVYAALLSASEFAKVFYDSKRQDSLRAEAAHMKEAMVKYLYDPKMRRFRRGIYPDGSVDPAMDSSLTFLYTCEAFNARDELVENTVNAMVNALWVKTKIGGLARYADDKFQRVSILAPNPWFVCTLWLARWYIARAASLEELRRGLDLLSWAAKHASASGAMAEQLNPIDGTPLSVSPLVWSHAEFIIAVCEYLEAFRRLSG